MSSFEPIFAEKNSSVTSSSKIKFFGLKPAFVITFPAILASSLASSILMEMASFAIFSPSTSISISTGAAIGPLYLVLFLSHPSTMIIFLVPMMFPSIDCYDNAILQSFLLLICVDFSQISDFAHFVLQQFQIIQKPFKMRQQDQERGC